MAGCSLRARKCEAVNNSAAAATVTRLCGDCTPLPIDSRRSLSRFFLRRYARPCGSARGACRSTCVLQDALALRSAANIGSRMGRPRATVSVDHVVDHLPNADSTCAAAYRRLPCGRSEVQSNVIAASCCIATRVRRSRRRLEWSNTKATNGRTCVNLARRFSVAARCCEFARKRHKSSHFGTNLARYVRQCRHIVRPLVRGSCRWHSPLSSDS